MHHIEFIGIPGSGKSTLCKQLVHSLRKINENYYLTSEEAFLCVARIRIDKVFRQILRVLPDFLAIKLANRVINRTLLQFEAQNEFLACYGEAFQDFLSSESFFNLTTKDSKIVIGGFLQTGALYQLIKETNKIDRNSIVFYDEGLVQKSMMFVSHRTHNGGENENLYRYLDHIPLPDVIIFVEADLPISHDRMVGRQKGLTGRTQELDKDAIKTYLRNAENHWNEVVAWLKTNRKTVTIKIANYGSVDKTVKDLKEKVIPFLHSQS